MNEFNRWNQVKPAIFSNNNHTPTQVATAIESISQENGGCKNTTQNILDFEVDFELIIPCQTATT